jgi:hypothetical protein
VRLAPKRSSHTPNLSQVETATSMLPVAERRQCHASLSTLLPTHSVTGGRGRGGRKGGLAGEEEGAEAKIGNMGTIKVGGDTLSRRCWPTDRQRSRLLGSSPLPPSDE